MPWRDGTAVPELAAAVHSRYAGTVQQMQPAHEHAQWRSELGGWGEEEGLWGRGRRGKKGGGGGGGGGGGEGEGRIADFGLP